MKSLFKVGLLATVLVVAGCNKQKETEFVEVEPGVIATNTEVGASACPSENILSDTSTYPTETADITLSEADFFAANGKQKGVVVTPSGLQYRINKSGPANGPQPAPTDTVVVHYQGHFLDGKTFDSSYDRGDSSEFPLNRVIRGWTEGVGLMRPCDAWTFYVPSDLAYGKNGGGPIPPATPLVFNVQLIEVK